MEIKIGICGSAPNLIMDTLIIAIIPKIRRRASNTEGAILA